MISAESYEELYEILSYMDKSTVMKIPIEILEQINKKRNYNYITRIDSNDIFNLENISEETINVLAWLDINYWMKEERKERINEQYRKRLMQEELLKKANFSTNSIFPDERREKIRNTKDVEMVVTNKETIFEKMWKKLKNIFK